MPSCNDKDMPKDSLEFGLYVLKKVINMSSMAITSKFEWKTIDWAKVQAKISKLQRRIYRASQSGNLVLVRKLQKILTNSFSAKLLATRKVTQDNQEKKTAGVDGVKSLKPQERLKLAQNLEIDGKSSKIRRVWIPKSQNEKRGLGIPTIRDRAKQALLKMALEPEWEAVFEPNSYGFRPSRSAWDAIEAIKKSMIYKQKYVLDADIAKCFDKINHKKLINKATKNHKYQKQIKAWLKAGIMEKGITTNPESGTPQGGVISPLLANIAFHGMELAIDKAYPATKEGYISNSKIRFGEKIVPPRLVRYADDFVVLSDRLDIVLDCKEIISQWLGEWGLELKDTKTQINHSTKGFDFLGFNIRHYEKGRKHTGNFSNGSITKKLTYKTYIIPSKKSVKSHLKELAESIAICNGKSQKDLIHAIQRKITGWCNYYRHCNSKQTFSKLNHLLWKRLLRWGVRRHRMHGTNWVVNKYWRTIKGRKWTFTDGESTLRTHDTFQAGIRFIKIKGNKSPFDGDTKYWQKRTEDLMNDNLKKKLLADRKGNCSVCKLVINLEDKVDIHHIVPKSQGGKDKITNLSLIHKHCHHQVHGKVAQVKV
jgi:RNA-directed DNA polymerase